MCIWAAFVSDHEALFIHATRYLLKGNFIKSIEAMSIPIWILIWTALGINDHCSVKSLLINLIQQLGIGSNVFMFTCAVLLHGFGPNFFKELWLFSKAIEKAVHSSKSHCWSNAVWEWETGRKADSLLQWVLSGFIKTRFTFCKVPRQFSCKRVSWSTSHFPTINGSIRISGLAVLFSKAAFVKTQVDWLSPQKGT